jgi:hypothetical protein
MVCLRYLSNGKMKNLFAAFVKKMHYEDGSSYTGTDGNHFSVIPFDIPIDFYGWGYSSEGRKLLNLRMLLK